MDEWEMNSFWLADNPNEPQSDLNQIPSKPPYWQSGFLSLQLAIDVSFIQMVFIVQINRTRTFERRDVWAPRAINRKQKSFENFFWYY